MLSRVRRPLIAVAAALALVGIAACADPDNSSDSSATTLVKISQADTQTIPPTSSTLPPGPGEVSNIALDYEVKSGDTLYGIAARFKVDVNELISYNDWTDGLQHQLHPGDHINIPPGFTIPSETTTTTAAANATAGSATAGTETSTTVDTTQGGTWVIKSGDTLIGIAKKVGTTVDAIVAANGWTDGSSHNLHPGDTIKIP